MSGIKRVVSFAVSIFGIVIGLIGSLWQKLVDMWEWYESVLRKVYDTTGLVGNEAQRVRNMVVGITNQYVGLGVTMESAAEAAGAISEEFHNIGVMSASTVGTVALLKTTMGLAESEGAKLTKIFMTMTGYSEKLTKSSIASVKQMAIMAKVAPRKVMGDIAKNSEMVYKYFRGSRENAMKFAVIINSIGKSMDVMKSAADALMDWDSSIEKEMNASVLLGRTVDFSAARMKVFKGDMSGALDDIIKQVGSADKLSKMSIYQHQAISDATGISTENLMEMITQTEKLSKFEAKYGSLSGKTLKEKQALLQIAKRQGDANAEAVLTQNIQQTQVERFKAIQEQLKMKFLELAQKFFPIILKVIDALGVVFNYVGDKIQAVIAALGGSGGILSISNDIGKIIESIGKKMVDVIADIVLWIVGHKQDFVDFFKGAREFIVDQLVPAITGIWEKLKGVGAAIESFFGMFVSKEGKSTEEYWYAIGLAIGATIIAIKLIPVVTFFGSMIKGAIGAIPKIKAVTAAWGATNTAVKTTSATTSKAGVGIAGFLTKLGAGLKSFLTSLGRGLQALGNPKALLGILGVSAAIISIGLAIKLAEGAIKILVDGIVRTVEIIVNNGDKMKLIFQGIGDMFRSIFSGLAEYVTAIFGGIATVLSAPFLGVAKIVEAVFTGVKGIIDSVGNRVVNVIDSITNSVVKLSNVSVGRIALLAGELATLGLAMAGMGVMTGISGAFSSLFGGDSLMDQIAKLTKYQESIGVTATKIQALKLAFANFKIPTLNDASVDTIKDLIESIAELSDNTNFVVKSTVEYNNKELVNKLDSLIRAIENIKLTMDGREIARLVAKQLGVPQ